MNGGSHLFDGDRRLDCLGGLVVAAAGQVFRDIAQLGDRRADLARGRLHLADDLAQLADHEVERIGDGAGDVLGDLGLDGQVAFGNTADLLEELHHRRLHLIALLPRVNEGARVVEHGVQGAADAAELGVARTGDATVQVADRQRLADIEDLFRLRDDGAIHEDDRPDQSQDERRKKDAKDSPVRGDGVSLDCGKALILELGRHALQIGSLPLEARKGLAHVVPVSAGWIDDSQRLAGGAGAQRVEFLVVRGERRAQGRC